jgi:chromosome segregation ATPase
MRNRTGSRSRHRDRSDPQKDRRDSKGKGQKRTHDREPSSSDEDEDDDVRRLGRKAREAREAAAQLEKVLKVIPEPSEALRAEVQRLQEAAKALAMARDQAKPQEVRDREMRSRFRTLQGKLEANVKRKSVLEADIKELQAKLAKQQEALAILEDICQEQDRKVRELHTALGTIQVETDSEQGSADGDSDMDADAAPISRRKDGWGVVGKKGKVLIPPAFTAAEQTALAMVRGGGAPAKAGEEGERETRSRSPPGQRTSSGK